MISDLANLWRSSGMDWRCEFIKKHSITEVEQTLKYLKVEDSIDGLLKAIHAPMKGC